MHWRAPIVLHSLLLILSTVPYGAANDNVKTEAKVWERRAIYSFQPMETYNVTFCMVGDETTMLMALVPMNSTDTSAITSATTQATELTHTFSSAKVLHQSIDHNGTEIQWKNESANVTDVLYQVEFGSSPCIQANLTVPAPTTCMMLTKYSAKEVSVYIEANAGTAITPLQCVDGCVVEAKAKERTQSWFAPIMASLIISITSLIGVVILGFDARRVDVLIDYMTSFAAGCLLGVVVYHLYPEGSNYLSTMGDWVMGTCVLGGIALSMSLEQGVHLMVSAFGGEHSCHSHGHKDRDGSHANHTIAIDDTEKRHSELKVDFINHESSLPTLEPSDLKLSFRAKYITSLRRVDPIAWITAVGDFFHAFTDGVVLAVAFKSCSSTLGWAVMFGILLHEVPHRVGDFFIFLRSGMLIPQALVVNFLASLASLFGVIILFGAGAVSDHALGILLAFGAGALLFIAMEGLLPPMMSVREPSKVVIHFLAFSIGCGLIGLSKLQDVECEA